MLLTLAALLALSATGEGRSSQEHDRASSCEVVDIRSDQRRHDDDHFRATQVLELRFEARLLGHRERRRHTLKLRLYTPGGFLYQVLAVPVDADGRERLEARLPVAGTSIMASGLYGRWRVVPHLDESPDPCGPGRRFTIRP